MLHRFVTRIAGFLGLSLLCAALPAHADNIPGSPGQVVPELTETATDLQVRSIKDNMRPLRAPGSAGVSVSTSGVVDGIGGSFGGDTPLALRLDYRDLDTDRLDGSLTAGSVLMGRSLGERTLFFGGLVTERLDTDTLYNDGWIDAQGVGLAVGLDHQVGERLFLTGILGHMALDYDVSRNGGITGSFDARRTFLDLSGDYMTRTGNADLTLGAGLLYVTQKNDSYTESGGAAVEGFTSDRLTGKLMARSTWGQPGEMRPYLDAEGFFRLSGSTGLPTALDPGDEDDWSARLGVGVQQNTSGSGFDVGIGANFGDDAFEGLDAKLRYMLRF